MASTLQAYGYEETLAASEKVAWRLDDLLGPQHRLDFQKPFLPETLARVRPLDFLSEGEQLRLNQIRGHGYLYMFGLVEEFILPFVLDHCRQGVAENHDRTRAFLQFAGEEAKHIELFRRFRREFEAGFPHPCEVIGPPEAVAEKVLGHHPLAVAITILHIEWMTQRHWVEAVQDDQDLDPRFKNLLKHHWLEEAQHAKLDTLMIQELALGCDSEELDQAVQEYLEIGAFLDQGLAQQVEFDLAALQLTTGRVLKEAEAQRLREIQHQANRWTFLGSGMSHPQFLATLESLKASFRKQLEQVAPAFC
ncbi:MAG: hypothetical protein DWQ01_19295 [Planctomycetota bacterium]|nr:MAG: hypothetical protein DWQ01_19295 [Planctomycetota bacterium]